MSERTDELIENFRYACYGEASDPKGFTQTRKETCAQLEQEIAAMERVVQAAGKYIGNWIDEAAWQELVSAVRAYQERE